MTEKDQKEIDALTAIYEILKALKPMARQRVLEWATAKYLNPAGKTKGLTEEDRDHAFCMDLTLKSGDKKGFMAGWKAALKHCGKEE